eukprot:TRINITY_DN1623_c0_g2_i1.p1 TRINITY_DN1623_c0_g2~~TRINITY_DN1623_c0_g2_i1.p1  ORF type:complete len:403 (-),score=22.51 TRINITY_DN1623_c0_g2_i1:965-2125(-)
MVLLKFECVTVLIQPLCYLQAQVLTQSRIRYYQHTKRIYNITKTQIIMENTKLMLFKSQEKLIEGRSKLEPARGDSAEIEDLEDQCIVCKENKEPLLILECGDYCCKECAKDLCYNKRAGVLTVNCPFHSKSTRIKNIKLTLCGHMQKPEDVIYAFLNIQKGIDTICSECGETIAEKDKALLLGDHEIALSRLECEQNTRSYIVLECRHYCYDLSKEHAQAEEGEVKALCNTCESFKRAKSFVLSCCKKEVPFTEIMNYFSNHLQKEASSSNIEFILCPCCHKDLNQLDFIIALTKMWTSSTLQVAKSKTDLKCTEKYAKRIKTSCHQCGQDNEVTSCYLCKGIPCSGTAFCKKCLTKYIFQQQLIIEKYKKVSIQTRHIAKLAID